MDTSNLLGKEKKKDSADEKKFKDLENKMLSKDDEIKLLKEKLAKAQKSAKQEVGDIRKAVNRQGDPKKIVIGTDDFGRRLWKTATELTDADIKRREEYISGIRQMNARKNN